MEKVFTTINGESLYTDNKGFFAEDPGAIWNALMTDTLSTNLMDRYQAEMLILSIKMLGGINKFDGEVMP